MKFCTGLWMGIALALLAPGDAFAQRPSAPSAPRAELEEVVITAQRREQSLVEVPAAISVVAGERLSRRAVHELSQLGDASANLKIQGAFGNASNPVITIRGVGLQDFNDNSPSAAGVYVDDVYQVSPTMLAAGLFDVERVEVLKGPQGTLYGRNTTAGAINLISRAPTEQFEGYVSTSIESFGRTVTETAVGGPLTERLAVRLSGTGDFGGDYQKNRFSGRRSGGRDFLAGRAQLQWRPTDRLEVLFKIHGSRDESDLGQYQQVGLFQTGTMPCAAALRGRADGAGCVDLLGFSEPADDPREGAFNRQGDVDYRGFGASARLLWEVAPELTLTSITASELFGGLRREESDASPNQLLEVDNEVDVKQFSQELRLSGRGEHLDWVLGLYFGLDQIRARNRADLLRDLRELVGFQPDLGIAVAENRFRQQTASTSIFGHLFWDLSERWSAELGLRYSDERRRFRTQTRFLETPADRVAAGLAPGGVALSESPEFDTANPIGTFGLSYRWREETRIYAKLSNGFRSGGFNGSILLRPEEAAAYDDENLLSYEIGIKGPLLGGRVRYDAAAFYYDYRDLQVFEVLSSDAGVPAQVLTNAADSRIYGLDANLSASLSSSLSARVQLGLLRAEFVDAEIGGSDLSGQRMPNAPKLSLRTGLDYERELRSLTGRLSLEGAYQSRENLENVEFGAGRTSVVSEDPYWIFDLEAGVRSASGRWELSVFAKNLFDEQPLTDTLTLTDFGFAEYIFGLPRRVGANLRVNF